MHAKGLDILVTLGRPEDAARAPAAHGGEPFKAMSVTAAATPGSERAATGVVDHLTRAPASLPSELASAPLFERQVASNATETH